MSSMGYLAFAVSLINSVVNAANNINNNDNNNNNNNNDNNNNNNNVNIQNSNNNQNNMNKPLCFVGTTTAAVSVVSIASSSRMRQCAAWKLLNRIWKTSPVDRVRVRLTANNAYNDDNK